MRTYAKAGIVLSLALLGGGCSDFLQGPGLTENPNSPTNGTMLQQLIAVQANVFTLQQGQLARQAGIYTQQIIGSNNQQLLYATQYAIVEGDISPHFSSQYTGGGLVGMRNIQALAEEADDKLLNAIARVLEALTFGNAAGIWGDLPYSEALHADILTPKLDPQESIYAEVQKRLDEALVLLAAAPTTGNCDNADLVYCASTTTRASQVARWTAAANTLKARYYLHLVERNGNAAYSLALAAAQKGISEAPATAAQAMHGQAPGDFRAFHGATTTDGNIWAQFLLQRQDLVAGNTLISLLKQRSDPRLAAYFDANANGEFLGMDADAKTVGTGAPSVINVSVRRALTFRQPIVTWAENQLIQAEAKFKLTGADAALPHVNAVRQAVGLPPLAAVTFEDVMIEKYIAQYQNIDAWADFKRTCIPLVKPYLAVAAVPGRLPYGSAERTNNPNIPLPSAQPARNWNDPAACPRP